MSYVVFRGVSTSDLGVYIAKGGMPAHKKAPQRHTEYEIPGREGAVHIMDGYGPFDLKVVLQMIQDTPSARTVINAWADGSGDLYSSDNPSLVWRASVLKEVKYGRAVYGGQVYDTATITFRCQPIMRERVPTVVTLTSAGVLSNIGNVAALPKIIVRGSGDCRITIGGQVIELEGVSGDVTIDSEAGYVYTSSGAVAMTGEFPVLGLGDTEVSFNSAVSSLTITPNWGWL